jgi:hypothetical protein
VPFLASLGRAEDRLCASEGSPSASTPASSAASCGRASSESKEIAFVAPCKPDELSIHPSMRMRLEHDLAGRTELCIG